MNNEIIQDLKFKITKFVTSKAIVKRETLRIGRPAYNYLIGLKIFNHRYYEQVPNPIVNHYKLNPLFRHWTNRGQIILSDFQIKLNKMITVEVFKRKNKIKINSPLLISIRMRKTRTQTLTRENDSLQDLISFNEMTLNPKATDN